MRHGLVVLAFFAAGRSVVEVGLAVPFLGNTSIGEHVRLSKGSTTSSCQVGKGM